LCKKAAKAPSPIAHSVGKLPPWLASVNKMELRIVKNRKPFKRSAFFRFRIETNIFSETGSAASFLLHFLRKKMKSNKQKITNPSILQKKIVQKPKNSVLKARNN